MIPSVLARHVEQGVKDFLRTTFPVTTPFFAAIIEKLLSQPGSIFKGPFLEIQLPFRQGKGGPNYFPDIPMQFPPYLHQEKAFDRLSGENPQSAIIATGTGSGKTECFIYPILDHCYRHRREPGIKAILIYPMNALAADQAARLSKRIHNSKLRGHITAGIYIGQQEKNPAMQMTPDRLISDRNKLRLSPPDILLTNYKMLDYLLIRPHDRPLWSQNTPETLRYLVVDELHTFDGAQGTDLGCLIRRLKSRLCIEPGYLCCVGTSATLGTQDAQADLIEYSSAVFGETFTTDAIISEYRLGTGEFLGDCIISRSDIVPPENAPALDPAAYANYQEYIRAQHRLWLNEDIPENFDDSDWRITLGPKIKAHLFFQNLIRTLNSRIIRFDDIISQLEKVTKELNCDDPQYKANTLNSLLALISEARIQIVSKDQSVIRPFLNVRLQLWMRELRRMVADVSKNPSLRFADDLNKEQLMNHLPLVHCRECGAVGWSGLKRKTGSKIMGSLKAFYHAFFSHDPKVVYLFPEDRDFDLQASKEQNSEHRIVMLCAACLNVHEKASAECTVCGNEEQIRVNMWSLTKNRGNRKISTNDCPYCNTQNSLTLMGSRAASLTSVMIVQLYSSTYNDDKKLLTFSDNVQDAAHRAGFFNARTFRFNFRTALQKVILTSGHGSPLSALPDIFIDYWKNRLDQNRYIATFLAPNMEWLSDYDHLKTHGKLPDDSSLIENINQRIGWEIVSEYGFQARIGRSLEKTGSSVAFLNPDLLKQAADHMLESIRNEIGLLRELDPETLIRFLLGLIVHLKNQGGIFMPDLDAYIESFGAAYLISRKVWTPNFGPNSRTPAFLTTRKGTRFDQISSPSRITWYQNWSDKCLFTVSLLVRTVSKDLYTMVLKELTAHGILEQKTVGKDIIWGIRPQALNVSSTVSQFRCRDCGHNISVATEERMYFQNSPCQRFQCAGRYDALETGTDYYGKLYASGDVERIFAWEHTGLLKRDRREQLENEFKSDNETRKPWYPNLLSCTPTLEMGIDIGSLSSLILCSVPPSQSNYIQRIGRAGRRDGNALDLTVANARPHDLFFFAEPEQMLAGSVESPGIFLDASAVLERQFTAFCFDNWIISDPGALIPERLGQVLENLEPVNNKKFPHSFIHYIETNQTDLFDRFLALFKNSGSDLSTESQAHLKTFLQGDRDSHGSLYHHIMNGLHSRRIQRDSLQKKVQILAAKIKSKKNGPKDKNYIKELRELEIEKSAVQTLVKDINGRITFNFFTDEGLIPNYAFPEAGVVLKSVIYRKKQKVQEGESSYDTWAYDCERPASSALAELAPANTFYAEARKVKIDQVDMAVSEIQNWRFCNNCSHRELTGAAEEKKACPNCGSPIWADTGQKRMMLRMRQVFASASDRESRISDDSDDREPVFYNKQILVEFDDKYILDAYKVDADFPFGFDFLSKVDFCEINFGENTETGDKLCIAGVEMPRKGFSVCRVCGKVQEDSKKPSHAFTCTAKEKDSNLIDCIYLYRQFMSEAIRILLPVDIISAHDRKLHSFIAAIQLGLKKKFKGKIDHLQTTVHEEPLPDSSLRRKYLVLYDTVPGGTGYLKQLMRSPHQLADVLELSFEALKSCPCDQDENKDGCYRCLFAYRNSYTMPETSRDTAIELLAEILSYRDMLVKTENTRTISFNTFIESELEARFIGALKLYRSADLPLILKNDLVNGKPGYFLKIRDRAYSIEPQVLLGELSGISIESRADFVIRPARFNDNTKPVAVFLDGFTFHCNRIGQDMAQRMAIVQSGKYLIWSLTWNDVENRYKARNNFFADYMNPAEMPSAGNFKDLLNGYGLNGFEKYAEYNSFDLLMNFLENPDEEKWRRFMFVMSLLHIDPSRFAKNDPANDLANEIDRGFPYDMAEKIKQAETSGLNKECFYGRYENEALRQYVAVEQKAMRAPINPFGVSIGCCFTDDAENRSKPDFQQTWNGFLRLYNYYQFLPYSFFVTSEGIKAKAFDSIRLRHEPSGVPDKELADPWDEVKELTDEQFHGLLDLLRDNGWQTPEPGFELAGADGEISATAEFAWEELKIALLTPEEMKYQGIFEASGWKAIAISENHEIHEINEN
jgi:DEAD/DEAH box helicase domain-containing protein